MTVQYRTKGFVFKREDRLEADRVFSVFTYDFGRIEIFAKAIRKMASKLKSGIEIFSLAELSFIQGRNRKTLTDALLIQKFRSISESPEKMAISINACNLLHSFIKGQEPDEKIWNLVLDFFQKLDTHPWMVSHSSTFSHEQIHNVQFAWYYCFFWNFISALGYGPEIYKCSHCSQKLNPYHLYFSNEQGGIVCKSCLKLSTDAKKINSNVVKIMRLMLTREWDILSKLKIEVSSRNLLQSVSDGYAKYLMHSYAS